MLQRLAGALAVAAAVLGIEPVLAASREEFDAAWKAAEARVKEAAAKKTQWTTTTATLASAKKAADAGNLEEATALAQHADDLAAASLRQSDLEAESWKDAVIR